MKNWEDAGLPFPCLARSARSALKSRSNGESSLRGGTGIGAREGEAAREFGDPEEFELLSGGGVGGSIRDLAGTDLERNLGIGRADGAGEAWKVGPAYAPWFFAGVAEIGLEEAASVSVREPIAPGGEKVRSPEG